MVFDLFSIKNPEKAIQKAREYVNDGRMDAAIKLLENNLTEGEDSLDVYLNLARLYFETEERTRAARVLREAKAIAPSSVDEIVALVSELYYQHPSIDLGDYYLQLQVELQNYDEITKILSQLTEHEIKLLITRYDKIKQNLDNKNVVSERDFENMLILSSLRFVVNECERAAEAIDAMIDVEIYGPKLLKWSRIITRERYNDWRASLLLVRVQMANQDFHGAINQAKRTAERFADSTDSLIAIISAAKPSQEFEDIYKKFLTDLYIKKGDLDSSIKLLVKLTDKETIKIDDAIKGLRELQRINPQNLRILYALGDTYVKAGRMSLAVEEYTKILEVDSTQYEQVMQKYRDAFEKEPHNPEIIEALVKAYLSQNEINAAVDIIETSYKLDPGFADEYILNLNKILEKDLNHSKALYLLGLCYAHKGDHDNASIVFETMLDNKEFDFVLRAAEKIQREHPNSVQYLNLKAKSMIMLGRGEDVLSELNAYLKDNPDKTAAFISTLDTVIRRQPELSKMIIPMYEYYKEEDPLIAELAIARAYGFADDYGKSVEIFEQLFSDEEHKDAIKRALIEVIKEKPRAVPLLLAAARMYMKEGEVEIATQFFKTAQMVDPKAFFKIVDEFYEVLKTFPKDREVRILLVDTFFNRKVWDKVIEECKRAIDVFGRDAQYFNLKLGEALVENGNLSDAVRPLMLSLDGPEDYSSEVIAYLDKILNIDKSNLPAHFARGRALSKARRVNEAVEEYLMTARTIPARAGYVREELARLASTAAANPSVMFAMGSIELMLERYDDAIKHLLQACELDAELVKRVIPHFEKLITTVSSPLLEFSLAKIYYLAGLKSSAVRYYIKAQGHDKAFREPAITEMKKICEENPDDIESRKGLAEIYFDYNNLDDALDLVSEVYKSNPHESDWAKQFVSQILEKNPTHYLSYYLLAYIFMDERDDKKAVEVYKKLIEMSPAEISKVMRVLEDSKDKSGDLLLYSAILHKDTGDIDNAIKLFDILFRQDTSFGDTIVPYINGILEKNANMGEAHLLVHRIFSHQKKYKEAIEAIRHARQVFSDDEAIILKEGQTYYEMGDAEQAISLYNKLLERTKDRRAVYRLIKKTRTQYLKDRIEAVKGDEDVNRLERARIYLLMDNPSMAERELRFTPKSESSIKEYTVLRARFYLKKNRPIDALEIMKNLPVDDRTASVYADIYETMGSYEAAALILRKAGVEGMEQRIASYEKLAQERRLAKGKYFVEGRSR